MGTLPARRSELENLKSLATRAQRSGTAQHGAALIMKTNHHKEGQAAQEHANAQRLWRPMDTSTVGLTLLAPAAQAVCPGRIVATGRTSGAGRCTAAVGSRKDVRQGLSWP